MLGVLHLRQFSWIWPHRSHVASSRRRLIERLVRPEMVVPMLELIEALLLKSAVGGWIRACYFLELPMHPFVSPILLWFPRFDQPWSNA